MLIAEIQVIGMIENINSPPPAPVKSYMCFAHGTLPSQFQLNPAVGQQTLGNLTVPNPFVSASVTYPIGPEVRWDILKIPDSPRSTVFVSEEVTYVTTSDCFTTTTVQQIDMYYNRIMPVVPLDIELSFDAAEPVIDMTVNINAGVANSEGFVLGEEDARRFGPIEFSQTLARKHTIHLHPKSKL